MDLVDLGVVATNFIHVWVYESLTPLPKMWHLQHGGNFNWWVKQKYLGKTTNLSYKNKKYHTVEIVPKTNRKNVERRKMEPLYTQIHDRSHA
jgi:hypothetical protein